MSDAPASASTADDARRRVWRRRCWIGGGASAVVCLFTAFFAPDTFFPAWLVAAVFAWSVPLGGLFWALIFGLTGGQWGRASEPWFRAAARTMPFVAVLFVPLFFGLDHLYSWTDPRTFAGIADVSHRQWYFEPGFFTVRSVGYFAVWIVLSVLVAGLPWRPRDRPGMIGGQAVAGLGMVALLLSTTYAAFDWMMSLDPFFGSTIFGALIGMGAVMCSTGFIIAGVALWPGRPTLPAQSEDPRLREKMLSDLGNLLLAMVMLWTYFSFAQLLIMWTGDLPVEAQFYMTRVRGGWKWVGILLAVGGFAVPFACLLSFELKRDPQRLGRLAIGVIALRVVELYWFVMPNFSPNHFWFNWVVIFAVLATGGLSLAFLLGQLPGRLVAGSMPSPLPRTVEP